MLYLNYYITCMFIIICSVVRMHVQQLPMHAVTYVHDQKYLIYSYPTGQIADDPVILSNRRQIAVHASGYPKLGRL